MSESDPTNLECAIIIGADPPGLACILYASFLCNH
jgi:hypothetical protein